MADVNCLSFYMNHFFTSTEHHHKHITLSPETSQKDHDLTQLAREQLNRVYNIRKGPNLQLFGVDHNTFDPHSDLLVPNQLFRSPLHTFWSPQNTSGGFHHKTVILNHISLFF